MSKKEIDSNNSLVTVGSISDSEFINENEEETIKSESKGIFVGDENSVKFAELTETSGVASITDKLSDEVIVISESTVCSIRLNEEVGDRLSTDKSIELTEFSFAVITESEKL